ncbi:hypothetical protein BGZ94_010034 [Podila epigama]|nr:hypothetical protein BGZ94_010034 [Podila epigama]
MLFPVIETVSIRQARAFQKTILSALELSQGLDTDAKKREWAVPVQGNGWKGFWIPFQDQLNNTGSLKHDNSLKASTATGSIIDGTPIGTGCDVVVMAVHGGGYIDGHALMFLDYFKRLMKHMQKEHALRIGIVSVEYSLSPEVAYPVAMNECIAAYSDLVKVYNINTKRIILSSSRYDCHVFNDGVLIYL